MPGLTQIKHSQKIGKELNAFRKLPFTLKVKFNPLLKKLGHF